MTCENIDKVYVLVIDTQYGAQITAHATQRSMEKYLFEYVSEYWHELGEATPEIESFSLKSDAVAYYFEDLDTQWHISESCEIQGRI